MGTSVQPTYPIVPTMPNSSDATTATGSATKAASHEKLGIPKLYKNELMWPPRYHFLLENGYLLRERYRPLDEPRNHFVGEAEIPTLVCYMLKGLL